VEKKRTEGGMGGEREAHAVRDGLTETETETWIKTATDIWIVGETMNQV
jgi:hypothetical protein